MVHKLGYPAEKIAVKWIGCADNYWAPGGGAVTIPSISGTTYSRSDNYTSGFACKANLYYGDDSGDFVLTGCDYGL
ncbi:MAG: hypothetical protein IIV74_02230 [Alphaproteobacteria bacterium]|nr:hypothetical protein [Alphaproteobacteria bacterium]